MLDPNFHPPPSANLIGNLHQWHAAYICLCVRTLYAAYAGCPIKLSPLKTFEIVTTEGTKVTY